MSFAVNVFVHAILKHSMKCLVQKVDNLGSLRLIPMIQPPFNSSCLSFSIEWFQSYMLFKLVQEIIFNT